MAVAQAVVMSINQPVRAHLRVIKRGRNGETLFASEYFQLREGTLATKQVYAGTLHVAAVLEHYTPGKRPDGPTPNRRTFYYHGDHLGSTNVLTTEDGEVHEHLEYFPDGEVWIERGPRTPVNGYRFTGKEQDQETGLYDFGQRFYDPTTSLWLSTDPMLRDSFRGASSRPQALSPYAYASQNPTARIDPDGRQDLYGPTYDPYSDSSMEDVLERDRYLGFGALIGLGALAAGVFGPSVYLFAGANPEAVALGTSVVVGAVDPHPPGLSPLDIPGPVDDIVRGAKAEAAELAGRLWDDAAKLGDDVAKLGDDVAKLGDDAARGAAKQRPALPDEYWFNKTAPTQVEPGTRRLTDPKPSGRSKGEVYERTTHFDEYGRQVGQTHKTAHGQPTVHPNPHHHTRNPGTGEVSEPLQGVHPDY